MLALSEFEHIESLTWPGAIVVVVLIIVAGWVLVRLFG
jgi:hypothetical protein